MKTILMLRWMKLRDDIKLVGFMTAITFIMIAVFASIDYSEETVKFGFIDEDFSKVSQMVLKSLDNLDGYDFDSYTLEEGKIAVRDGDIEGAFYVKDGFMTGVLAGEVTVEKLLISENMNNLQMNNLIYSATESVLMDFQLTVFLKDTIKTYGVENADVEMTIQDTIDEHWAYKRPISVSSTTLKEETAYSAVKHSVVGFSLFFAMFTIVFGVSDILMEKEYNTWQRQMVSPISKFSILSGNLFATFALGFLQVSLMFLASKYVFKVEWAGNMLHLVLIIAAFVFCVAAIGMTLSNFVNTIGQLSAISPVIITGTAMLGGCFWPLEIVTAKPLLFLSMFTPQRWAIAAIEKVVVHGYHISEVMGSVGILLGMGTVYMILGTYLLERKAV